MDWFPRFWNSFFIFFSLAMCSWNMNSISWKFLVFLEILLNADVLFVHADTGAPFRNGCTYPALLVISDNLTFVVCLGFPVKLDFFCHTKARATAECFPAAETQGNNPHPKSTWSRTYFWSGSQKRNLTWIPWSSDVWGLVWRRFFGQDHSSTCHRSARYIRHLRAATFPRSLCLSCLESWSLFPEFCCKYMQNYCSSFVPPDRKNCFQSKIRSKNDCARDFDFGLPDTAVTMMSNMFVKSWRRCFQLLEIGECEICMGLNLIHRPMQQSPCVPV